MENNDKNLENKKTEEKNLSAEEVLNEIEGKPNKEHLDKERKQLRNVLLGLGIFVIVLALAVFFISSIKSFEYKGVTFIIDKDQMKGKILYKTLLPLYSENGKKSIDYKFWLRNDPRKMGNNINFNGEVVLTKNVVINMTGEDLLYGCNKDGIIAIANLRQLYEIMGAEVMKDENATCDTEGRYTFIQIEEGNETNIEQYGASCYKLIVNNCEIFPVTERFMIETFAKVNG